MASSVSHQIGEYIGTFLENCIISFLKSANIDKKYYLDYRHPRIARDNKSEVIGIDAWNNNHKLDIVIEENGSEKKLGIPRAYIEVAWRRYTKHSKNKVQEISGAILPIIDSYSIDPPYYCAVLGGEFTQNALTQLESVGFDVFHIPYKKICETFQREGVDIHWEEESSEKHMKSIMSALNGISNRQKERLVKQFISDNHAVLTRLYKALDGSLNRVVTQVTVLSHHGYSSTMSSPQEAIRYVADYKETDSVPFIGFELRIKFNNNEEFALSGLSKTKAIQFLRKYDKQRSSLT